MKVAAPMIHIEVIIIGLGHNHKHHRHWIKGCAVVGVRHSIIEGFSSSPCVITGIIIMIKNFYHHLPLCQFSSEWDYFLFFRRKGGGGGTVANDVEIRESLRITI